MRGFGKLEAVEMDRVWSRLRYGDVHDGQTRTARAGWAGSNGKAFALLATLTREDYSARLMRDALAGGGDLVRPGWNR